MASTKGDLGAVDALLFDSGQKLVLRALIFLNELVPCRDFLVETGDVFERIVSRYDFVENTQKVIEDIGVFGRFRSEPAVGFGDFAVKRCCLVVLPESF